MMMKLSLPLLVALLAGCGTTAESVDVQSCKVYGLKAYQEADLKRFKEIVIKDCTAIK